jgi:D-alanyl-D-alanine carboxypeptidase
VHAKTGSTGVAVALTGFVTTDGGRLAVFSAVANGDQPDPAVAAIDQLVVRIASDTS